MSYYEYQFIIHLTWIIITEQLFKQALSSVCNAFHNSPKNYTWGEIQKSVELVLQMPLQKKVKITTACHSDRPTLNYTFSQAHVSHFTAPKCIKFSETAKPTFLHQYKEKPFFFLNKNVKKVTEEDSLVEFVQNQKPCGGNHQAGLAEAHFHVVAAQHLLACLQLSFHPLPWQR